MTSRRRALLSLAGVAAVGAGVLVVPAESASAAVGCSVTYSANSWSGGFSASIKITNLGSDLDGWTLGFGFGDAGQKVGQGWSATYSQTGTAVTAGNVSWNGKLATGASTTIGFNGTWTASNPTPTSFTLNGVNCSGSVTTTPTGTTTPPSTSTPPSTTTPPGTSTPPSTSTPPTGTTPVAIHGQLHVCGVHLCDQNNAVVQLRGMSTHGIQWFGSCYNDASFDALAKNWKADLVRIAMYVQEKGYETNPSAFTAQVNKYVDMAEARGLYSIIDFHTLTPGDPNYNLSNAKTFFAAVAARNAAKKNVIYEIANEPNGVSWSAIKTYAEQVIPVIRAADPDAVVIVGTRGWSSLGVSNGADESEILNAPVNATNIMYTFHYYAASHGDNYRTVVARAAQKLPLFVTEYGTVSASGDGAVDRNSTSAWYALLDQNKISSANWTFSDASEGSAAFKAGTCSGSDFSSSNVLSDSGAVVKAYIGTPHN